MTFMENYKKSASEVKKAEDKYKDRHKELDKEYNKMYGDEQSMLIRLEKGLLHVTGEFYYQIQKLKYIKKDNPVKFVVRNRINIAGAIVVGGLIIGGANLMKKTDDTPVIQNDTYTVAKEVKEYKFHKLYSVKRGDTLEELCEKTGLSKSDFKNANKSLKEGELLFEDTDIIIPFTIKTSDIGQYTKIVDTGDLTVKELADEYETDITTLEDLNNNSFDYDFERQKYIPVTEQIIVPAFDEVIFKDEIISKSY